MTIPREPPLYGGLRRDYTQATQNLSRTYSPILFEKEGIARIRNYSYH